ncbi:MAG: hypothetical protein VX549_01150 [Pseudomonadota bacterium]|nr:hypothetical protein [Pseudomonadota bacterium]
MHRFTFLLLAACAATSLIGVAEAQAPREQALLDAVDRAESKHGRPDTREDHRAGRGHGRPPHDARGRPAHRRGHSHRPHHHPRHPSHGHHYNPGRRWISEYEARRLAASHYHLGVHSAHLHDGLWTLIGYRHGHGSIRVVLDAFSGQVVGYFPLHPHRGWRW